MRSIIEFRVQKVQGQDRIRPQSVPAIGQEVIISDRFLQEALAGFPTENFYTNKSFVVTRNGNIITINYGNNVTGTLRIDSSGPYTDPGRPGFEGGLVHYCTRLT